MNVVMDVGPAVHQSAGLNRYATSLAENLLKYEAERVKLTFFYNDHSARHPPKSLRQHPTRTIKMGQYPWRLSVLLSQLTRRSLHQHTILAPSPPRSPLGTPTPTLYHATEHLLPHLSCSTTLTVHDLIFERHPEHHTLRNRIFLKFGMRLFVRAADRIIAVSQHTKRDLEELYGVPSAKICVIYQGIDTRFAPAVPEEVTRVQQNYSPDRPYLLMVSTLDPRKNHIAAFQALAHLKQAGFPHRLIVVGGTGWMFEPVRKAVDRFALQADVLFTGYLPDADLPPLYSGAACVLMPSLYEGFGFSVLEAMACGVPVVCSNVSSLPEAAGDVALMVAPTDVEGLAAAVRRVLTEPELVNSMQARGLTHAAQFQWHRCAKETLEVYEELGAR